MLRVLQKYIKQTISQLHLHLFTAWTGANISRKIKKQHF